MKSIIFTFLFSLFILSCKQQICGTYEIIESTKFEKELLKENLDSLKYLRKNNGKYILKLKCDSIFYLKDFSNENIVSNFEGKWKYRKGKISLNYIHNNYNIEKVFLVNKNTLLNIQELKLCENGKYINNIIFLTKTKNPD